MKPFVKSAIRLTIAATIMLGLAATIFAQSDMRYFITRSGDKLMEGDKVFRFISFNAPNLHLAEDNLSFDATNPWRMTDEFEIADTLDSIKQMGGMAVRTYVISVRRADDGPSVPRHVLAPGKFNEEMFRTLDKVLQIANQKGVRVIVPLVDQWRWWGGIGEYAAFRNKKAEEFWTDPQLIADFKQTINFIINRKNTYTGTLYKDDKAILAWETGNEISCPYSWTKEIAAYIKSLDSNHLVWDGMYIGHQDIQPEALADPNIDIVSSHHYPEGGKSPSKMADDIVKFHDQIGGKRPYIVGEFGFVPLDAVQKVLDTVISNGVTGAMVWSLRFHNRDGGFYWHSEGASDDAYKSYHYPGFVTGDAYQERGLLKLMREKAFEIRGLSLPPPAVPSPPLLLPIKSVQAISWQGSVGASGYNVERSISRRGPWTVVGADVDDSRVQYQPLFSDSFAEIGRQYFYRVRAKNETGVSKPSNMVGPVKVDSLFIVDEMRDLSRVFAHSDNLSVVTKDARKAKEYIKRVRGGKNEWLAYRTLYPLRAVRLQVFFEKDVDDFDFLISKDGINFTPVKATKSDHFHGKDDYGYWKPVTYEISAIPSSNYFLKVVFKADAQISRFEIEHRR